MKTSLIRVETAAGADEASKPQKPRPRRQSAPPELADVALIDAPRIAAAACMALSTFYELVRAGRAPQPVVKAPRCTRWRVTDVRNWLQQLAERGSDPAIPPKVECATRPGSQPDTAKRALPQSAAGASAWQATPTV